MNPDTFDKLLTELEAMGMALLPIRLLRFELEIIVLIDIFPDPVVQNRMHVIAIRIFASFDHGIIWKNLDCLQKMKFGFYCILIPTWCLIQTLLQKAVPEVLIGKATPKFKKFCSPLALTFDFSKGYRPRGSNYFAVILRSRTIPLVQLLPRRRINFQILRD